MATADTLGDAGKYAELKTYVKSDLFDHLTKLKKVVQALREYFEQTQGKSDLVIERPGKEVTFLVRGLLCHVIAGFLCDRFRERSEKTGREYHLFDLIKYGVLKEKYCRARFDALEPAGATRLVSRLVSVATRENRSALFRAFVAAAINGRGLHEWMRTLLGCKPLIAKFYERGAAAADPERVAVFLGQLAILSRFDVLMNLEHEGLSLKRK